MSITIKHLRSFVAVARHGNFTRAAQALNLSKSVVSQHVSDLERELNVRLLNRSTRSVGITHEGHTLAGMDNEAQRREASVLSINLRRAFNRYQRLGYSKLLTGPPQADTGCSHWIMPSSLATFSIAW